MCGRNRNLLLTILISFSLISLTATADESGTDQLALLMETDYYALEKKEKKQDVRTQKSITTSHPHPHITYVHILDWLPFRFSI